LWGNNTPHECFLKKNKAMATTDKNRQSKRQSLHNQQTEKYKQENQDTGRIIFAVQIIVFLFSIATMYFAVVAFTPALVLVGIFIEFSNAFVQAEIAKTEYSKSQYLKDSIFKDLLPIPSSRINLKPILYTIIFFWVTIVSYSAYYSAEQRNRQDTEEVGTKIDSLKLVLISNNAGQILDEKSIRIKTDSLKNVLSLLNKDLDNLDKTWGHRDKWTKENYYFPKTKTLNRKISKIEVEISDLKKPISKTDIEQKKLINEEIKALEEKQKISGEMSFYDKWRDFFVHLLLMILSIIAIRYSTFAKVKYKILCGYGFKTDSIIEDITPSVNDTPKTVIMKEALETVKLKRKGSRGKEKEDVSLSDYLGWKNDEQYHRRYKAVNEQLKANYVFISGEDGIDRVCPTIKKK
jgi:hypothetical protein